MSTVRGFLLALVSVCTACVPEGPATPPEASNPDPSNPPLDPGEYVVEPYSDSFERAELGGDWNALDPAWHIEGGRLCAENAKNHGVWLSKKLPPSARVEFDAIARSPEGDLKAELWGDGKSGASGSTYSDATSYLAILGGWNNSKHVLARLDEHAQDRLAIEIEPGSDDERARPVQPGQAYHFSIERKTGGPLRWSVNGNVFFELDDPSPLSGPGHENLGFNDWVAPVCFDNVTVTPL